MNNNEEIVSRHFFRRTARARARSLDRQDGTLDKYVVRPAQRGPFRWYVVKVNR